MSIFKLVDGEIILIHIINLSHTSKFTKRKCQFFSN